MLGLEPLETRRVAQVSSMLIYFRRHMLLIIDICLKYLLALRLRVIIIGLNLNDFVVIFSKWIGVHARFE